MALQRWHLDIAFFGLILLLGALVVRGWMREGAEIVPPGALRSDAKSVSGLRSLEVLTSAPSGSSVDLLAKIDPSHDSVAGDWSIEKTGLRSPPEKWARLQFPCRAPAEYDLRLVVTRLDKTDALILGAIVDGRQCQIVLDGNGGRGSWIEVKEGAHGITPNGVTYFEGPVFANGRPSEVLVAARKNRLEVRIDGFQVLVWRGPQGKLFIGENWDVPDARALFIGAWQSVFSIGSIELASVTGEIDLLR